MIVFIGLLDSLVTSQIGRSGVEAAFGSVAPEGRVRAPDAALTRLSEVEIHHR